MLIFVKGSYEQQIVAGTKTATIRAWRSCKMRPGDLLSFNGRVRARITRVTVCRLSTLTPVDWAASGFSSRAAFLRAWRAHYPHSAPDAPCVVLHFRTTK